METDGGKTNWPIMAVIHGISPKARLQPPAFQFESVRIKYFIQAIMRSSAVQPIFGVRPKSMRMLLGYSRRVPRGKGCS